MSEKIQFIYFFNFFFAKNHPLDTQNSILRTLANVFISPEKIMNYKIISSKNVPLYTQKSILRIAVNIFSLKVQIIALFLFESKFWHFFAQCD